MKPQRALAILLLLALLLSSVPTTGRSTTWAAEPQVGAAPTTHVAGPLNTPADADDIERLPFDLPVGKSVEQQDDLYSVFSDPAVPSAPSSAGEWQTESADGTNQLSRVTGRSLQLDGDRQPQITHGEGYLDYARDVWTAWQIETVTSKEEGKKLGRVVATECVESINEL